MKSSHAGPSSEHPGWSAPLELARLRLPDRHLLTPSFSARHAQPDDQCRQRPALGWSAGWQEQPLSPGPLQRWKKRLHFASSAHSVAGQRNCRGVNVPGQLAG